MKREHDSNDDRVCGIPRMKFTKDLDTLFYFMWLSLRREEVDFVLNGTCRFSFEWHLMLSRKDCFM